MFLTSLVVQATATLFLFLVFLVLYRHSRQLYFAYWTAGWGVLGLGLLALLLLVSGRPAAAPSWILPAAHHWSIGIAALLVIFARHAFATGRGVDARAWVFTLPLGLLLLLGAHNDYHDGWLTAPRHLLFAIALWASGHAFYSAARRDSHSGAGFLSFSFGLWGLQQTHYAVLFLLDAPAPSYLGWIAFADTALALFVALGMIRFALDEDRGRLIESARQLEISEQRLQDLAMRDPLTGLFNRRHFDQVAPQVDAQARRLAYPVAVVVVDLNHFKDTNDRDGHQRGDQILRVFAEFLRRETRTADMPFRWGGDEFLLLMLGLSAEDVGDKTRLLREAWDQVRKDLDSEVTLALGWAMLDEDGLEAAIRRADRQMYGDKRAGRGAAVSVA